MANPKRTQRFYWRVTPNEYEAIAHKTTEAGISISDLFRRAALGRKQKPIEL